MSNPLTALSEAIIMFEDLRVGQIISNATDGQDLYFYSDERLEKELREYIKIWRPEAPDQMSFDD